MPNCKVCGKKVKRKICRYCSRDCYKQSNDPTWYQDGHEAMPAEKHPLWKGDKAGYRSLHAWAHLRLKRPKHCSKCGKLDKFIDTKTGPRRYLQLANISGEYHRDLADWTFLCPSCHVYHDQGKFSIRRHFLETDRSNP